MTLEQLKIDYINFITHSYSSIGFDPDKIGVLFSLLLEQEYLTQEEIMGITGFSRSKVSIALNELTDLSSQFPVLQTKRPGDKRKFYKCPLSFEEYARIFFTASFEITDFSMDFLRDLVARLEAFEPSNPSVDHVKNFFKYTYLAQEYYKAFIEHSKKELKEYFNTKDLKSDVFVERNKDITIDYTKKVVKKTKYSDDKFIEIKKEYLSIMQEISSSYTGRKELISVFLSLYLEFFPITQDHIIELTNYSRSTVSEALSILAKLNRVQIIKKPKDRKKYYKPFVKIEDYGFLKFQNIKHFFTQIIEILQIKFLKELEELKIQKSVMRKYRDFFTSNIYHFEQLLHYSEVMYEVMVQQFHKKIKLE